MRDVDERVAAVQGRVRRMKRKRDRATVGVLATLSVVAVFCLVGVPLVSGQPTASSGGATLFGAASLFGPSAGGYVLVALVAAVAAVLITVFCMMRRRSTEEKRDLPPNAGEKRNLSGSSEERGSDGNLYR